LPVHPVARLGTVTHAVLESAVKGLMTDMGSFESIWNDEQKKVEDKMITNPVEAHLVPLETTVLNYDVKKLMCFGLIEQFLHAPVTEEVVSQETEKWVESSDGKIGGMIDLVIQHKEGAEIVDYKTGSIVDEQSGGGIKEDYVVQLKLYAGIYFEALGSWPVRLSLIGLDKKKYDVSFSHEDCLDLMDKARQLVDEVNELIESGLEPKDFANPSPSTCKYCSYRPACRKYWLIRNSSDGWPIDASGKVKTKTVLGNGFCRVELDTKEGSCIIRGLGSDKYKFLNTDASNLLFCNLANDSTEGHYKEQLLTAGYAFENEEK